MCPARTAAPRVRMSCLFVRLFVLRGEARLFPFLCVEPSQTNQLITCLALATSSAFAVGHRESGGSVRPVISRIKYEAITYGGLWCTNSLRQKRGRILTAAASLYERAAAYVS